MGGRGGGLKTLFLNNSKKVGPSPSAGPATRRQVSSQPQHLLPKVRTTVKLSSTNALSYSMITIFIQVTFLTLKKDLYAKNIVILYEMIKSKTTNRIAIKNIYITINKTLNIYIRDLAKTENITFKKNKIS